MLGEVKTFLISLDSAMNFAIYFVMSVSFRKQLASLFGIKSVCTVGGGGGGVAASRPEEGSTAPHGRRSYVYRSLYISEV